jgi:hypothetical protein
LGQAVQDVGQAVVVEVQRPDGLAQQGLEGELVLLGPRLQAVKAVVALGEEEGQPDGHDLPQGQLALPEVVLVVVELAVQEFGDAQPLQAGEQDGQVVDPLDVERPLRGGAVHGYPNGPRRAGGCPQQGPG